MGPPRTEAGLSTYQVLFINSMVLSICLCLPLLLRELAAAFKRPGTNVSFIAFISNLIIFPTHSVDIPPRLNILLTPYSLLALFLTDDLSKALCSRSSMYKLSIGEQFRFCFLDNDSAKATKALWCWLIIYSLRAIWSSILYGSILGLSINLCVTIRMKGLAALQTLPNSRRAIGETVRKMAEGCGRWVFGGDRVDLKPAKGASGISLIRPLHSIFAFDRISSLCVAWLECESGNGARAAVAVHAYAISAGISALASAFDLMALLVAFIGGKMGNKPLESVTSVKLYNQTIAVLQKLFAWYLAKVNSKKLENLKGENLKTVAKMKKYAEERREIAKKLEKTEKENENMCSKIKHLEDTNKDLSTEIQRLKTRIVELTLRVKRQQEKATIIDTMEAANRRSCEIIKQLDSKITQITEAMGLANQKNADSLTRLQRSLQCELRFAPVNPTGEANISS